MSMCVFSTLPDKREYFVLTQKHRFTDASVSPVRVPAEVNAAEKPQLLRILRVRQVQKKGDNPTGHCPLCQSLVHHVVAPVILQEAGGDEQSPEVALLHSLAQLCGHGPSWTLVPVLQEAPEAAWRGLQVGSQPRSLFRVTHHRAVAHQHVILFAPAQL